MDSHQLKTNLDYLTDLAKDGSGGPIRGASFIFSAGLVFSSVSLLDYVFKADILPIPNPWFYPIMWIGGGIVFAIICAVLGVAIAKKGPLNLMNKAVSSVWQAIGWGIFVSAIVLGVGGAQTASTEIMLQLIAPVVLVLYGVGWWLSAMVSSKSWLKTVSIGSFMAAVGTSFLINRPEMMLVYAGALFLLAVVPGFILMREAGEEYDQ